MPRASYLEALDAQGLEVRAIRTNDYRFISERALGAFESHTFGEIDAAAAAVRAPEADTEEVKQIVRTQLFVADSGRSPGIAGYAGRGSLRGWVRVIATRELLRSPWTPEAE